MTSNTYTNYKETADIIFKTASTINQIICDVYTASTYVQIINSVLKKSNFKTKNYEDVKQDLFMYLYDQPDKVVDLYNKGQLRFFFAAICKRQLHSTKSKLFGRYLNHQKNECQLFEDNDEACEETNEAIHNTLEFEFDIDQKIDNKDRFNYVLNVINANINTSKQLKRNLTIYLLYYIDDLTIKQISEKTTISQSLVYKYLRQARLWLSKNINQDLFAE